MFYRIAHVLVFVFAKIFFRLQVIGAEHVPRKGGVIVAANHNSYFDIPLLGCSLPRRADNIAKIELFKNKLFAFFIEVMGGFPVRRGGRDHHAIEEAVRRVTGGRLLVIYPEGTRSKDGRLQRGKPGVGKIVSESGVCVVPAFIDGTNRVSLFRRVTVRFGKPIYFDEEIEASLSGEMHPKILYGTIASKIMSEIACLKEVQDRTHLS